MNTKTQASESPVKESKTHALVTKSEGRLSVLDRGSLAVMERALQSTYNLTKDQDLRVIPITPEAVYYCGSPTPGCEMQSAIEQGHFTIAEANAFLRSKGYSQTVTQLANAETSFCETHNI